MADSHKNFAYGTVSVAPSPAASGTTLSLGSGEGTLMPSVPFNATVWPPGVKPLASNAEIVRVTAISGDNITAMTRAQEGTAAISIAVGYQFSATITAKTLTDAELNITDGTGNVPSGTLRFSNANGISFGLNGSTMTGSHNALTTARASNDAIGLNTALTAGPLAWTVNSSGLSLNAGSAAGTTSGFGGNLISGSMTHNTAGLNLSLSHPAWLTTARASNDAVGLNTAQSNVTWTVNSSGLSLDARGYAGTGTTFNGANFSASITLNSAGLNFSGSVAPGGGGADGYNMIAAGTQTAATTGTVLFQNSNGITFGMSNSSVVTASHNGLTTARASNDAIGLNTALTAGPLAWTVNSSGLSLNAGSAAGTTSGFGGNLISGSMTHNTAGLNLSLNHPAWLTTARASNDAIGLNTAQSNVTWTVNSSGLSLDARGYAGTGTTFNGANVSGSMTVNSAGVQLSLSAGAGGGVTPVASASNGSFSFTTLAFSNANNVTFGTSAGSIITASVAAPGAAAENNWVNLLGANTAGNTTASGSTIGYSGINLTLSGTNGSVVNISAPATSSLSATGLVSISTNGSTISIGVPGDATRPYYNAADAYPLVAGQQGQGTLHVQPYPFANVQFDQVVLPVVFSNATNSSGSATISAWVGIYSRNASTLSLASSTSTSYALTNSGTAGSYSLFGGQRLLTIGSTNTILEGQYYIGIVTRTTSGGANMSMSQLLVSQINSNFSGVVGVASNATAQHTRGLGVYTASTSGIPGSIAFTQLNGTASLVLRQPSIYFVSQTF